MPVPESREQELVVAAFQQLAESGFEGLRTRAVAARAGVNVATLHYYFPTKEALIRGVVGHTLARFRATLGAEGGTRARLKAHLAGVRRLAAEEPEVFRVMGELALRSARDPGLAAIFADTTRIWQATVRGLLERVRSEGEADLGGDPEAAAALVVSTLLGAYLVPQPGRSTESVAELERRLGL